MLGVNGDISLEAYREDLLSAWISTVSQSSKWTTSQI